MMSLPTVEKIRVGDSLSRDDFLNRLSELKYILESSVQSPGDFAHRGAIVDVYPVSYRAPVRVHFRFDKIDSIRDFSLSEGKSLTIFEELFLLPVSESILKKKNRLRSRFENFEPLTELRDIRPGNFVVHLKYGIGQFLGLQSIQVQGKPTKHVALEYADREILYLPIHEGDTLERYIGIEGKKPKLTKLHSREWERVKEKTRLSLHSVAHDMLELQARRKIGKGFAFGSDDEMQKKFESEFPFDLTSDQVKAVEHVKRDMEKSQPMDRLICGDVGYGKTEVAFRAAFKSVMNGKQAAFLVPTTILAEQHYVVLKRRLAQFPIRVGLLSRFQSRGEQKETVAQLKDGSMDIVIGTHRLLSQDIQFHDLGLVVIDEEQRFGVRHKEKTKRFRETVDVLTLTATPIPRTLYLSLMGARDMSVINTPPKQRLPIITEILEYDDQRVKHAIELEVARKGQVYFVHNRIESIEKIYTHLKQLVPGVRFQVAHGQMDASELETVMARFMDGTIDCLISTNIVESGLDIPNANTIIINRADALGLADLYQLRGRVGRYQTERQAYCYFLVPRNWVLTQDAQKRLNAIERLSELGSGFKIAMEDLEIRGAGNVLGEEQSGFIYQVGFDLYCRMLRKVIEEEKKSSD